MHELKLKLVRAEGVSAAQSPQRGAAVLTIDVVRRREQGRLRTGVFEGFDLGVSDLVPLREADRYGAVAAVAAAAFPASLAISAAASSGRSSRRRVRVIPCNTSSTCCCVVQSARVSTKAHHWSFMPFTRSGLLRMLPFTCCRHERRYSTSTTGCVASGSGVLAIVNFWPPAAFKPLRFHGVPKSLYNGKCTQCCPPPLILGIFSGRVLRLDKSSRIILKSL